MCIVKLNFLESGRLHILFHPQIGRKVMETKAEPVQGLHKMPQTAMSRNPKENHWFDTADN